ncbi:Mut7-C RNAse domain-containing protein [Halorubrum lacusprofundi]|jgi:hypothetical protein|uniref:Mut7-C RNAse domain-containing protein n=1 Tax=Halorubrum lacusprofundi (strain ATCC 49239 / DSM 5036 / JCM 8891 / ACAM 34) TaxID=416348 RepID=B9LSX8_HALLT|nr:Mut7-C RNAse domain-containing protein [Halorubrum lacusprofundi]ACM56043.1 protein of unknown function DUF82 [Halorubrum lacusprofundi ATCC 49239]
MPTDDRAAADDEPPRVLLDAMCGKLATYLRMCGYDAAYALDRGVEADDQVLALAAAEARTLITRDRELAARTGDAVLLTERDVLDQLREVAAAGSPVALVDEPTRCGACNGRVDRVSASDSADPDDRPEYVPDDVGTAGAPESEPDTADTRPAWRCRDCGRWFWKGSHWESIAERLDGI